MKLPRKSKPDKIKPLSFEEMSKLSFKERSALMDQYFVAQLNQNALRDAQPSPKPKKKRKR